MGIIIIFHYVNSAEYAYRNDNIIKILILTWQIQKNVLNYLTLKRH